MTQQTKTISNLMTEYAVYLRSLNYSEITIKNIKLDMRLFLDHLEKLDVKRVPELRKEHIFLWQEHIANRLNKRGLPVKSGTVNQKVGHVKGFLRYLAKKSFILPSVDVLRYVRMPQVLPGNIISHARIRKLLNRIDTSTPHGHRDRTMLELLYSSGIRAGEMVKINVGDIDFQQSTVKVQGKGRKERITPIGKTALRYLETHIKAVRGFLLVDRHEKALFLNKNGGRLSYDTLADNVRTHCGKVKDSWITPHTFRRSCTTELVRGGANLYHVKELLGHESLTTLKHYAKLSIKDLKKTHEKFHPRERDS